MGPLTRRPLHGRPRRPRTRLPRSRRVAVPLGLVLTVGAAAGVTGADAVGPAGGGDLARPAPGPRRIHEPAPVARAGRRAGNGGLEVTRATYTRDDDAGGTLDVFASSGRGPQSIVVSGEGVAPTRLIGAGGHYQARVAYTGESPPIGLTVANVGDRPATRRRVEVDDSVFASAVYDLGAHRLTIRASSSDTLGRPRLTAAGIGVVTTDGVLVADVDGAPAVVTVASVAGGSVTVPVALTGPTQPAIRR